jgi:hypothetical protein
MSNTTLDFSTPSAQNSQSKSKGKTIAKQAPTNKNKGGAKGNLDKRDKKT